MTITVRAGTTVADLQATLAERGQRTALPSAGGTIGGSLAVGENDIRLWAVVLCEPPCCRSATSRLRGGSSPAGPNGQERDRLRSAPADRRFARTLGLIGEVILRTNPIPAVSRWLKADDAVPQTGFDVVIAPSAVLYDGSSTWVELEDTASTSTLSNSPWQTWATSSRSTARPRPRRIVGHSLPPIYPCSAVTSTTPALRGGDGAGARLR